MILKRKLWKLLFVIPVLFFLLLFIFDPVSSIKGFSDYNRINIYDKDKNLIQTINDSNYVTSTNEIPDLLKTIIVYFEDKAFYEHNGYDINRLVITSVKNLFSNNKTGASTITMQYIKNNYLSNTKSISRKVKEIYLAAKLEKIYTKDEIIIKYLNTCYYGLGEYGIVNASKHYFNKKPIDLNVEEMALLYSFIQLPSYYSNQNNYEALKNNKDRILNILYEDNLISYALYAKYYNTNPKINYEITSYKTQYLDLVLQEFNTLNYSFSFEDTIDIYTAYDSNIAEAINSLNIKDALYSVITTNNNGLITFIGSLNYNAFITSTMAIRDIGSTIKPFLYYEALNCHIKETTKLVSEPITIIYNNEPVSIHNYNNNYPTNPINMEYALATSDNIYAVKILEMIGTKTFSNFLKTFDIEVNPNILLALGNIQISQFKLTEMYYTLKNNGKYKSLKLIEKVESNEKTIYKNDSKGVQLLDSDNTKKIVNMMKSMFTISSTYLNELTDYSGKSGLTNYDSYMIGFNDTNLISVWVGTDKEELTDLSLKILPKQIFYAIAKKKTS